MPNQTKDPMRMIYDFSQTEATDDLSVWDEIIESKNSSNLFFFPNTSVNNIRLLGPFFVAKRVFVPENLELKRYITTDELKQLVLKENNVSLEEKLLKKLSVYKTEYLNSLETTRAGEKISVREIQSAISAFSKQTWQKVLLINGYVQDSSVDYNHTSKNIKIITFTIGSIRQLQQDVFNKRCQNAKINGIMARDILVRRNVESRPPRSNNNGLKTDEQMQISDDTTMLPEEAINKIMKNGILDIKKALKSQNNKNLDRMHGYFHIIEETDFKAPEEFSSLLMTEINDHKQELSIKKISNYKTDNLPPEATDDQDDLNNPIMNMDID